MAATNVVETKKQNFLFPEMENATPKFEYVEVEAYASQVESTAPNRDLVASVGVSGVLKPIIIDGNGAIVKDGLRRLKAASVLGIKNIPALIFESLSPAVTIATNACRSRNHAAEFAAYCKLRKGNFDLAEISVKTGLPLTKLKPFEKMHEKLCATATYMVQTGEVSQTTAKKLMRFDAKTQASMLLQASEGEASTDKEVRGLLESTSALKDVIGNLPPALFSDRITVLNLLNQAASMLDPKKDKKLLASLNETLAIAGGAK